MKNTATVIDNGIIRASLVTSSTFRALAARSWRTCASTLWPTPRGTMALVGLPPGRFELPTVETVLRRITVRGSIVGTRQDLEEALAFAGEGKVTTHYSWDKLSNINAIFDRMEQGGIDGRIVLGVSDIDPTK